jgi:LPS O-antigen subunit length determinant protein (WzzB/FepE family)
MSDEHPEIREVVDGPPRGYFVVMPMRPDDSSFNLTALVSLLLAKWRWLVAFGFTGALIAAIIAINTAPVFRAQVKAVLVDPSEVGGASALRNQLGGLAALAGLDMGNGAGRKQEAYATLTSAGFARDFILTENLKPVLYAEIWDPEAKKWRDGEKEPTLESAVVRFMSKVMFVNLDVRNGMVDVAMEWTSPAVAANWANLAVAKANERIRAQARSSAARSIEYLNEELAKTSVVELRQAIHRLIEVQINNAMLANVQSEYAFRVVDSAVAPEKRVRPKRIVMVLGGGVLGGVAGVLFILLRRGIQHVRGVKPRHETHA